MADPESPPPPSSPERAPEGDAVLRIQANLYDFAARNARTAGIIGGVLVVIALGYGAWSSYAEASRSEQFAAIHDVDRRMPKPSEMSRYGLAPPYDPNDAALMADLQIGANKYREAADAASGPARVFASLKEAQVHQWRAAKDDELAALERAANAGGVDVVGFAAEAAFVDAMLRADRYEEAIGRAQAMSTRYPGALAEESWLILVRAQLQAGKTSEAVASFQAWRSAFPSSKLTEETALSVAALRSTASAPSVTPPTSPGAEAAPGPANGAPAAGAAGG